MIFKILSPFSHFSKHNSSNLECDLRGDKLLRSNFYIDVY